MKKMGKKNTPQQENWTRFLGKDLKRIFSFVTAAIVVCIGLTLFAMFGPATGGGGGGTFRPHGRIVITSDSKSPNGIVSATFERCRYFLIYDLARKKFRAVANPFFTEMNPGAQAAQFIANKNEEAVITGNIGAVALQTLENFDIHTYLVPKISIRDAVSRFLDGRLIHIETPNQIGGLVNVPGALLQQPLEMQRVAFKTLAGIGAPLSRGLVASHRMAYCPTCGLKMPLGHHIRTNRIMCPYCPGQNMKIMMPDGSPPGGPQPVGFVPGGGATGGVVTRGVVILR